MKWWLKPQKLAWQINSCQQSSTFNWLVKSLQQTKNRTLIGISQLLNTSAAEPCNSILPQNFKMLLQLLSQLIILFFQALSSEWDNFALESIPLVHLPTDIYLHVYHASVVSNIWQSSIFLFLSFFLYCFHFFPQPGNHSFLSRLKSNCSNYP